MSTIRERPAAAAYPFGLIDETAKREIRRACLKAIGVPGYQVPFASREMPMARGFGTGGLQITLSIIGPDDCLKVIDQGADDSVNACAMRQLIVAVCPGVQTTTETRQATLVQTRHRVPEAPLDERQILVLQVPYPDPLVYVEASERRRVEMHGEADYARMYVRLYEDLVHCDEIQFSYRYPTRIHGCHIIDPSPIPRYDVPRLHLAPFLSLFGAGREKKIYAVPPYTRAEPLEFEDVPFRVERCLDASGAAARCSRCGKSAAFLVELYRDDGTTVHACSDTEHCQQRREGTRA